MANKGKWWVESLLSVVKDKFSHHIWILALSQYIVWVPGKLKWSKPGWMNIETREDARVKNR